MTEITIDLYIPLRTEKSYHIHNKCDLNVTAIHKVVGPGMGKASQGV